MPYLNLIRHACNNTDNRFKLSHAFPGIDIDSEDVRPPSEEMLPLFLRIQTLAGVELSPQVELTPLPNLGLLSKYKTTFLGAKRTGTRT